MSEQQIQEPTSVTVSDDDLASLPKDPQAPQPELILGKFKSTDDLIKSYVELERKMGGQRTPEVAPEVKPEVKEDLPGVKPEEANLEGLEIKKPEEVKPKDFTDLRSAVEAASTGFQENGEISQEHYDALEKLGLPKKLVDAFAEGQKALVASYQNEVYKSAGGQAEYNQMAQWAAQSLSEAQLAKFNELVSSMNVDSANMAIQWLKGKYQEANGVQPSLVQGTTSTVASGGFASDAELQRAISDPRYARDPAYRKSVMDRLAISEGLSI